MERKMHNGYQNLMLLLKLRGIFNAAKGFLMACMLVYIPIQAI